MRMQSLLSRFKSQVQCLRFEVWGFHLRRDFGGQASFWSGIREIIEVKVKTSGSRPVLVALPN